MPFHAARDRQSSVPSVVCRPLRQARADRIARPHRDAGGGDAADGRMGFPAHMGLLALPAAGFLLLKLLSIGGAGPGAGAAATHKAKERAARLPNLRRRRRGRPDAAAAPAAPAAPGASGQAGEDIQLPGQLPPFLHPGDDEMELYDEEDVEALQLQEDSQAKLLEMLQQCVHASVHPPPPLPGDTARCRRVARRWMRGRAPRSWRMVHHSWRPCDREPRASP
jgi:hypothetical protein